jgi:hypothetical protein
MIDLKKKCWREKVTAEITVAHVLQFAKEMGSGMNATDAALFLNEKGRAQAVWTHMMQAGEEFLKSKLACERGLHTATGNAVHKVVRTAGPASVSYQ